MLLALAFILGILPSLVWLIYYLRNDLNPEPNSIILEVFILGMISGGAAIGFQYLLTYAGALNKSIEMIISASPVVLIAGWAWIEEYVKYLAAKIRVLHDTEFDEPTDAMVYMIVAGLGFAAIENVLFVVPKIFEGLDQALFFLFVRFLTATLLHALASGIIGFFLALAIIHHTRAYLFLGFVLGVGLHTYYNNLIMEAYTETHPYILPLVLFCGIIFIKIAFYRLRNKKINFNHYE